MWGETMKSAVVNSLFLIFVLADHYFQVLKVKTVQNISFWKLILARSISGVKMKKEYREIIESHKWFSIFFLPFY